MSVLIPDNILRRIEEFSTLKRTGQIALNIFEGRVLTADVKEHLHADTPKILDKSKSHQ